MSKEPIEELQRIAENIDSLPTLKALIFHQDFVFREIIQPALSKLESSGNEKISTIFSQYNTTYRKMVAYLYKELLIAKNPNFEEEESDE